jgi:hypothetical protein
MPGALVHRARAEEGGGHAGVRDRERHRQVGQRQASVVRERDELLHDADAALVAHRGVPLDLLGAVAKLCIPPLGTDDTSRANRMIALLIDGLRYGANPGPVRREPGLSP